MEEQRKLPQPEQPLDGVATLEDTKQDTAGRDFVLGAVLGGLVGAATALFLAPKPGKELREDMNSQASNLKVKATEWKETAVTKGSSIVEATKDKTASLQTSIQGIRDRVASSNTNDEVEEVESLEPTKGSYEPHDEKAENEAKLHQVNEGQDEEVYLKAVNQYDGSETNV
ncbi:YtxH domain-containing protein [Bacillus coahuilensis]|uniref:YtxH domain-containing protein n=1 Tax=Bacillus coahuilensis TaxID=408580 RepID=UPI00018511A8|nr:YtxH domain-containing protein [Bacillus coahuilensis]